MNIAPKTTNLKTIMSVNKIILTVHCGVSPQERQLPQKIQLDYKIFFDEIPQACVTDELKETICYDQITQILTALAVKKEYKLLEHLAHSLFQELLRATEQKVGAWLKVTKLHPPIAQPNDGVSFEISRA